MLKVIHKAIKFWTELSTSRPNERKIIMALEALVKSRTELNIEQRRHNNENKR